MAKGLDLINKVANLMAPKDAESAPAKPKKMSKITIIEAHPLKKGEEPGADAMPEACPHCGK